MLNQIDIIQSVLHVFNLWVIFIAIDTVISRKIVPYGLFFENWNFLADQIYLTIDSLFLGLFFLFKMQSKHLI